MSGARAEMTQMTGLPGIPFDVVSGPLPVISPQDLAIMAATGYSAFLHDSPDF